MLIEARNLTKEFDSTQIIKDVSLCVEKGHCYSLFGDSGSGKTTLMKMLSGLLKPTSGEILYNGSDIYKISNKELAFHRNKSVGFVFQDFMLEENLTVYENVLIPLIIAGEKKNNNRHEKIISSLEKVGLSDKANQLVKTLSGGEKQRVSIARAIVNNPEIVFADEPTGNLDSKNSEKIIQLFNELNKTGITIFLVTHNKKIADSIEYKFYISDGVLQQVEEYA